MNGPGDEGIGDVARSAELEHRPAVAGQLAGHLEPLRRPVPARGVRRGGQPFLEAGEPDRLAPPPPARSGGARTSAASRTSLGRPVEARLLLRAGHRVAVGLDSEIVGCPLGLLARLEHGEAATLATRQELGRSVQSDDEDAGHLDAVGFERRADQRARARRSRAGRGRARPRSRCPGRAGGPRSGPPPGRPRRSRARSC